MCCGFKIALQWQWDDGEDGLYSLYQHTSIIQYDCFGGSHQSWREVCWHSLFPSLMFLNFRF